MSDLSNTNQSEMSLDEFVEKMPKIELHAHLNGSLNYDAIQELGMAVYGEDAKEFQKMAEKFQEFGEGTNIINCFEKFQFMHQLTATKKGLELATHLAIRDFANDNVIYLELRTTPKCNANMTQYEYLDCVLGAILEAQNIHPNITVKLIASFDRRKPVQFLEETLQVVMELKEKYVGVIVGIDLSGDPSYGVFKNFVPLLRKAQENELCLALHCAEIDNNEEAQEMIDFGMQRCGHGTFLNNRQIEQLLGKNAIIECCLSSNVKCKTVLNYENHHFGRIFPDNENAVVLCTDDSGVFDTNLSKEFRIAAQVFKLTKDQLLKLSINAAVHCFASENEKIQLQRIIHDFFSENSLIEKIH